MSYAAPCKYFKDEFIISSRLTILYLLFVDGDSHTVAFLSRPATGNLASSQ